MRMASKTKIRMRVSDRKMLWYVECESSFQTCSCVLHFRCHEHKIVIRSMSVILSGGGGQFGPHGMPLCTGVYPPLWVPVSPWGPLAVTHFEMFGYAPAYYHNDRIICLARSTLFFFLLLSFFLSFSFFLFFPLVIISLSYIKIWWNGKILTITYLSSQIPTHQKMITLFDTCWKFHL